MSEREEKFEKMLQAIQKEYNDTVSKMEMVRVLFSLIFGKKYFSVEQAWKASGFSSNMEDYFKEEDARFVALK